MVEMTPRERLNALRDEQGSVEGIPSPRQRLEQLRTEQGDSDGGGQGSRPSNNPVFELARKSGFLKGYLDQAAGINQILNKFIEPVSVESKKREIQGLETAEVINIDDYIEQEEKAYQGNRKKEGHTGFDWARLAGNVVSPVSLATAKGIPLGTTSSAAAKIGASAATGGVAGAAQPVLSTEDDFKSQKALQVGLGATIGAVAQPVISGIKGTWDFGKYLLRPFSKTGQMDDVAEMYSRLAGDSKNKLVKALERTKTNISGNKPTVAQSIAQGNLRKNPATELTAKEMIEGVKTGKDMALPDNFGGSIAKLESSLSKQPATGDAIKTVYEQQMVRRSNAVSGIVDASDDALSVAIKDRSNATEPLYKAVESSAKLVRVNPVLKKLRTTLAKHKNEANVTVPMNKILNSLKQGNILETNPQNLYSLSKDIKRMIESKTPSGANEFNVKVLSEVKKTLDKQIGLAEPSFAKAQNLFKEYSKPVNQIKVAREFGDALETALKEESPTPFINAMDKAVKTLKKSTGFARYKKLSDVMDDDQIAILNKVKKELIIEHKKKKLASGTKGTISELQQNIEISLPNMLSRPMMFANFVLRHIGTDMSPAYEKIAIKIQKNPKLLAELLKRPAENKERKMVVELLSRYTAMTPSQELSRGATAPTETEE